MNAQNRDASFADRPFGVPTDKNGRRLGRPPEFTLDQMERIREYYANTTALDFDLYKLSAELGKSRHNICRFARRDGLTNRERPSNSRQAAANRKPKWQDKPHPKGFAGKNHKETSLTKMSVASKRAWATQRTFGGPLVSERTTEMRRQRAILMQANRPAHMNYSNRKSGARADLGDQFFRSSWEANYARYLNFLKRLGVVECWQYEPRVFWFDGIRRGVTNYKPDFQVKFKDEDEAGFVEIKGWIVPKDKTKWARMKKYHPTVKLVIVKAKEYYAIQKKWASCIPNWEYPTPPKVRIRKAA